MKSICVLLLFGMAGTAHAAELGYSQLELAWQSSRYEAAALDQPDWRPKGVAVSGTWALSPRLFLLGEGVAAEFQGIGFGSVAAGVGIHSIFSGRFQLLATAAYKVTQQESNACEVLFGMRALPARRLELFAAVGYNDLHGLKVEHDEESYGWLVATAGARYYVTSRLAVGIDMSGRSQLWYQATYWRAVFRYDIGGS